jgi:putative ABC transport system substrate-binding protein
VIVAGDGPSAVAAKAARSTTPIIFNTGGDPIQIGLVTSLSHPEADLTGVNLVAGPLPAKQFGLLDELVPAAKTVALLINPNNANAERDAATVREAAGAIGVQIVVLKAAAESDFEQPSPRSVRRGPVHLLSTATSSSRTGATRLSR